MYVVMYIIKNSKLASSMLLSGLVCFSFVFASCAPIDPYPSSKRTYEGATTGAALGSVAGLLIDKDNRWRGAVIGGLIGAALGGTLTEISQRASREAAAEGRPVAYESKDGFQRVEATPVAYNSNTNCHKVRERVWQDGELVKDEVKVVVTPELFYQVSIFFKTIDFVYACPRMVLSGKHYGMTITSDRTMT